MSEVEKKRKILDDILGRPYVKGDEHLYYCPKCDHHKKKLSVKFIKNVFKGWVCDWSSKTIYRIVSRYGDYNSKRDWRSFVGEIDVSDFSSELFAAAMSEAPQKISLPDQFVSLANKELPPSARPALDYLESRGLTMGDIIKWKIGYCARGKYSNRIVVPSFDQDGDVNYFVTRSYDNNWRKYLNPGASRNIIFNDLHLDFTRPLTIVEGVFDAFKAGENAVPLLGSTLTEKSKLFYQIVNNDTAIYLALDPDARKKTDKIIKLFMKYDIETYLIDVDPFEDVGQMSKEEFTTLKQRAELLDYDNYLISRIMRI